jgi:hypothetical protein
MTRPLASYLEPWIADGDPLPDTVTVNAADLLAAVGELRRMTQEWDALRGALFLAANEAYQSEIVQTEMEKLTVGTGKEYEDRYEWIKQRREYWISEAVAALAPADG